MDVEQMLNDVADYFKRKIIEGEFEFKNCNEYTATVLIDEKYELELWIANEPKNHFRLYYNNFIIKNNNGYLDFKNQKERLAGWKQVKPYVENYRKKVLKREKEKEINKLKKELEALVKT